MTFVLWELLKSELTYSLTYLLNRSIVTGHFLSGYTEAFISSIVKKACPITDFSSCRPISKLSVVSKLLERIVVGQLMAYLSSADLLPILQSGFRPEYSTEIAVLQVLSGLLSLDHIARRDSTQDNYFVKLNRVKRSDHFEDSTRQNSLVKLSVEWTSARQCLVEFSSNRCES